MNNIILLGPPGAGKGTIAAMIKEDLSIPHVSTGDLFRENIRNQTELGKQAKEFMDAGKLVPDEVTINMLKDRISHDDAKNGFLLDGFPRTIPQADALQHENIPITAVIYFKAPDELIIQRLSNRRIAPSSGKIYNLLTNPPKVEGKDDDTGESLIQRDDDKPDVIKKRLDTYRELTEPLIEYYEKQGKVKEIDATGTPAEIRDRALAALK